MLSVPYRLSHALLWTDLPTVPYDNSGANVG